MNILFPVFAMLALTMAVAVRMVVVRFSAVKQGKSDPAYYKLYQGDEYPAARVVARHFSNLLETPPLFYVACIIAFITGQTGLLVLALAWGYVALRVVHTLIHLGSNVVIWRFRIFVLSLLILTLMLVVLFLGLL